MISELKDLEDIRALERLFADVWGRPEQPPIESDVLMALAHSGNYVIGAHVDGLLVGGLVGWLGGSPPDELHLHSHILGVVAGVAVDAILLEQREQGAAGCVVGATISCPRRQQPAQRKAGGGDREPVAPARFTKRAAKLRTTPHRELSPEISGPEIVPLF